MTRMRFVFAILTTLLTVPVSLNAWTITEFNSGITVNADGTVSVTETIQADFTGEEKHGIYRDIPFEYQADTGTVYTKLENISVLQDGAPASIDIERDGGNIRVKIGDPDETISGIHTYALTYKATGILREFDAYDELYWNVTGNGWDAPILNASAYITLPAQVITLACYKGPQGSTTECETIASTDTSARFATTDLAASEGLTVAVGFTHGVVPILVVDAPPTVAQVLLSPITLTIAFIATFAGMYFVLRHWWHNGRDRFWQRSFLPGVRSDRDSDVAKETILPLFSRHPVVAEYDSPDDLRPAELGVLMDERADTLDISATIVDLASRGYLDITEVPKSWLFGKVDYAFDRTQKTEEGVRAYEALLLKHLFNDGQRVTMSQLKDSFYTELKEVKDALYKEVVDRKLFADNPEKIRTTYLAGGIAVFVIGLISAFIAIGWVSDATSLHTGQSILMGLGIAFTLIGIAVLTISPLMPRKSGYGRELYQRALGYKLFVSGTEKYRAKFYENQNMFMSVLPYAIVMGVTDKLARAFKDMGITPKTPSWYHGSHAFNAAVFAGSMNDFSKSLGSAMASAPSSSGSGGGGSSGGGFGGGGGGSW